MSLDAYYALCDLYYHYLHESLLQSLTLGVTAFPFLCRSSPLCHWTPIMLYVICIIIISMSSLLQSLTLGVTAPLCHWTPIMLYVICIIIISMSSSVTRPRS